MNISSRLLALFCALLVLARFDGAHLHLCFDGAEAPIALHVLDVTAHHVDEVLAVAHTDLDLALGGDASIRVDKKRVDKTGVDVPVAVSHPFAQSTSLASTSRVSCVAVASGGSRSPKFLRPLVCGPPVS